jgi:hypothetical protein
LLGRLGDVLLLSEPERAELLRLAMPDLAPVVPRDASALYEALGVVRRAVTRLWTATSEPELFQLAGEEARRLLPHSELIWVQRSLGEVDMVFPRPGLNGQAWRARRRSTGAELLYRFTPEQKALFDTLWRSTAAGDILRFEAFPRDIGLLIDAVFRERGVKSVLAAHIRGSNGSGGLLGSESTRAHDVTELERTVLSTIAEFTSLALQ